MSHALLSDGVPGHVGFEPAATVERSVSVTAELCGAAGWDQLALKFADITLEQTQGLSAIRWPDGQIKRLALRNGDGDLVAASLLRSVQVPGTGVRMSFGRYAPLWRPVDRPVEPSVLQDLLGNLAKEFAGNFGAFLIVFPRCEPDVNDAVPTALGMADFKPMTPPGDRRRYFVDVSLSADELRASLSQKWRYHLKKSLKTGLAVDTHDSEEAAERFVAMHNSMVTRKGFSESGPIEQLSEMMSVSDPELRPKIFLATHEGKDVGGAVIDTSGEIANYMLGATTRNALELRAGYFLQWSVLEYLSSMPKVRWYGLGGGNVGDSSLHQFKRGLIGKTGRVLDEPDAYYRAGSPYAAAVGKAAVRMRWLQFGMHDTMRKMRRS